MASIPMSVPSTPATIPLEKYKLLEEELKTSRENQKTCKNDLAILEIQYNLAQKELKKYAEGTLPL